ncbi:hypothetical protein [Thermoactinospora rubra]|uniref:COG4315 family predicted lipoprotein n=1 Tax=Thermoactinospora rubra TaxID=1088767 RepID=UPI00197F2EAD|nr:hypothetical protein [Thermoactinospora rubra]
MRRYLIPAAAFVLVTGCGGAPQQAASPAPAATTNPAANSTPPASGAVVRVADSKVGKILVDGDGRTLYLFEKDRNGESTCYGECAEEWPPYLTEGEPQAGEGAKESLVKTVKRRDGSTQVVYGDWPLYYYHDDTKPGDLTGHDKEEFGAEWYALTASGEKAKG